MVLGALAALLEHRERPRGRGAGARRPRSAGTRPSAQRPTSSLTDIEMPGMTGLDLAAALRDARIGRARYHPHHVRRGRATCAARSTSARHGYLLKDAPSAQLARRASAASRPAAAPSIRSSRPKPGREPDPLTDRERQVLRLALTKDVEPRRSRAS